MHAQVLHNTSKFQVDKNSVNFNALTGDLVPRSATCPLLALLYHTLCGHIDFGVVPFEESDLSLQ